LRRLAGLFILLGIFAGQAVAQQALVTEIQTHGNRRIPADTMRARMFTRAGDVYDEAALQRDFHALWNTGYFDDLRFEREEVEGGYIVHIYVKEKPTIRRVEYQGLNAVSQSDVLERFKERRVGLTVENQYDPTRIKRAEVVLKELLAEHGRQFANIRSEIRPIPPAAVEVVMIIDEGPKVKVGKINIDGNQHVSDRVLRRAMVNSKPIGIPNSIFLENLFARTYNAGKLSEDAERVRVALQERGYFTAVVHDPKTNIRDASGLNFPFIWKKGGKRVDITLPVEEGEQFRLRDITFKGNKAVTNTEALRGLFRLRPGEIFNTARVREGLENMRKAYGELGFINFTPVPDTQIDQDKKEISLQIDIDEGRPFSVRRIEFQGNTTTRDKVIRRELALEEGGVYNTRLWEVSLLRLNQLQYFEQLNPEADTERRLNEQDGTVDLLLKVKEKGKNQIGLTGGTSGISGSFIGLNYTTNNFLGLGETLRIEANVGDRERNLLFGFTEPYLFDRPLQAGFTVFTRKYNFDQARQASILSGQENLNLPENFLQTLQNFSQESTGFTVSLSYPLRRSFKRVGLTYSFDNSTVNVFSDASRRLFEQIAFRGISGPNSLEGIVTSKLFPSFTINTVNSPIRPNAGFSFFAGGEVAGLGGNVKVLRPIVEFKMFRPVRETHVFGFRVQSSFLTGYGGRVAPPYERFYLGGETDLRGFDIRTVSPVAFLSTTVAFPLLNPDGTAVPRDPANPRRGNITVPIPVRRIVFPGGDTSVIGNVEYRIPIVGPVTLAFFADAGMNFTTRESQLRISDVQFQELNNTSFGCPFLTATFECGGGTNLGFEQNLQTVSGTNFKPRMSTGAELQVMMPVINAPFRIYWAYNPLILDTTTSTPTDFTREMFPAGAAGEFSYRQALRAFAPSFILREPRSTFRFTVSTTF
jgi:outer membrane protein insertion porin family